ncbi:MAG: copper chaperone PCu(A)C [Hyphomicrobiales bacterium]|nr:copper chaperone PCu(A)C [Hyphomicrobiales bacterium]MCP5374048.1 copper chaperone PCu(A)C [Hyphomicrobiales bacterium]
MKTIATLAFAAATLWAGLANAGSVTVSDAWARASAGPARAGAAFMMIMNKGEADKLVAAKADVGQTTELHTHIKEGDVMRMRRVDSVPVPAGGMAMLQPGGYHVMFMKLKAPLKEGSTFPLTLTFEKAGDVTVTVTVKAAGAMGGGHMHMQHAPGTMKKSN